MLLKRSNIPPVRRGRFPFIYLNVATTADGKLAPGNRHFIPFSSPRDQELLLELRTHADAVIAGARTVDAVPVNLGPGPARFRRMRIRNGLPEYNLRVVVTGSGTLNLHAEIFKHKFSPLIILTTGRAGKNRMKQFQKLGAEVEICGERALDFPYAMAWLRKKWGVKRLLCEGGGELNGALFRAGLVDRIYHTLCPVIFGGSDAPTLADGPGIEKLSDSIPLKLRSLERKGDELFLVYDVSR